MDQRRPSSDDDVVGDFHIHLTVAVDPVAGHRLPTVATRQGLKFTRIELPDGDVPSQPMFTARGRGTLAGQRAAAARWSALLRAEGLRVVRVKIEADSSCQGVPRTDAEVPAEHPQRHFEQHVKVVLAADQVPAFTTDVERHGARVSRNARRLRADGRHERFVTQRWYGVGLATARGHLDRLVALLRGRGYEVVEVEEEYVLDDDRPAIDAGWLDEPADA